MNATGAHLSPGTASRLGAYRYQLVYGLLAVALLASILTLLIGSDADW